MSKSFFEQKPLVFALGLAMALAATESPLWMGVFAAVVCGWKWLHEYRKWPVLPRKITGVISVLLLAQVYFQYRSIFGQEASNTLLLGMCALKIMDYAGDRDHKFLVLMGFIIVSMKSLFSIDFYWVAPSILAFVGLWWSLLDPRLRRPYKFLAYLWLTSLPLTVLLFFGFPRLVLPWANSRAADLNTVGFSDRLDPGSVAELVGLNQLAFRAKFNDRVLVPDSLYWRGSVLVLSEGLRWLPPPRRPLEHSKKNPSGVLDYEVILESGSKGYLFTLDQVTQISSESFPVISYPYSVFRAFRPLTQAQSYRVLSDENLSDQMAPGPLLLQTPRLSPRVQEWVDKVIDQHPEEKDRLKELKRFFSDPSFVYTLQPGSYGEEDLEEFIFDRKRGFCEHFAGAYATLARALKIPSRVVVGYQGGVFNPIGDFWKVSQRDAHAWVEIFSDDRWQRVDPVIWVAPLRINSGAESFFSLSIEEQETLARSQQWPAQKARAQAWDALTFWLDDLNYRWTYFLLEFDSTTQRDLWTEVFKNFGLLLLIGIVASVFFIFLLRHFLRLLDLRRSPEKFLGQSMERVRRWGEKKGIKAQSSEPPLIYLERLKREFPVHAENLSLLARIYDQSVYAGKVLNQNDLRDFKSSLGFLKK